MKNTRKVALCVWVGLAFVIGSSAGAAESGSIEAWGSAVYGVDLSHGFVGASAGYMHSLGLKADGSVVAWGSNRVGQCEVPSPNTGFVAVSAGLEHSLALKSDGSVVAWGSNQYGQCNVPSPNTGFVAVAAGSYHSLGLKADGSMAAWGWNASGQTNISTSNMGFAGLAGGEQHTLVLKTDGSIQGWADNSHGQRSVPRPNTDFAAVSAGDWHSLGLKTDGTVVTWGSNEFGQCDVPGPNADFIAADGGSEHSLGLRADGSVAAWGSNEQGQCNVPSPNTGFVAVSAGGYHSLGLKADGSIVCWGYSLGGTCNVKGTNAGFVAVSVGAADILGLKSDGSLVSLEGRELPLPNTDFMAVSAGGFHCLGLKSDGSVVAWGSNYYGQCNVPSPNAGFVSVSAGYDHSLILRADGSVVATGDNEFGQCSVPSPNTGFVAVSAGFRHSVGLKADGSVVIWGNNATGQCIAPFPNTGFVSVAAGWGYTLGLKSDGSVVGWGDNSQGQCTVPGPNVGFVAVAAGYRYSMGLRTDGSVTSWGDHWYSPKSSLPRPNTGIVAISAGHGLGVGVRGDAQASAAIPLALGERVAGAALPYRFTDYRLDLDAGQARHLVVRVHTGLGEGTWQVRGRGGAPVTPYSYDWSGHESGEPGVVEMLVPNSTPGPYFFGVNPSFGDLTESVPFEIEVLPVQRYLSRLTSGRSGNAGTTTIQAYGLGFEPGLRLELRNGATVLLSVQPTEIHPELLTVQLDLSGVTPGVYDVVAVWPSGAEERLTDAFEVVAGTGPRFEARISGPSMIRPGRTYTAFIEYANTGDADLVPPVLYLSNSAGVEMIAPGTDRASRTALAFLALSSESPIGVLTPGARNCIRVKFSSDTAGEFRFELRAVQASDEAVDWAALEPLVRPCCVADAEWEAYWAQVTGGMGSTWAALLGNLSTVLNREVEHLWEGPGARLFDFGNVLSNASAEIMSLSPISPEPGEEWAPETDVTVTPVGTFDAARTRTFVVSHGWNSGADDPLIAALGEALAGCVDSNVFLVDWREGAAGSASGAARRAPEAGASAATKLRTHVTEQGAGGAFWETVTYIGCGEGNAVNKVMAEAEGHVGKGLILDPTYQWGGIAPSFRTTFRNSLSIGAIVLGDANPCSPLVREDIADAQYLLSGVFSTAEAPGLHEAALRALVGKLQEAGGCDDAWLNVDLPKTRGEAKGLDGLVPPTGAPMEEYIPCALERPIGLLGDYVDEVGTTVVRPVDPNEKSGPAGTGSPETERFVHAGDELPYVVYFENKCSASVPAQEVVVTDFLDADLDWSTFRVTEIVWGTDHRVAIPPDTASFHVLETVPDHRPGVEKSWWVDVVVDVNYATGRVQWTFRTLDPDTGDLPEDVYAGFLPPNAVGGVCVPEEMQGPGEAHVAYTVRAKNDLAPGTRITNTATIVFDTEAPIVTNEVFNTIAALPVNVPNVVGMPYADAELALVGAGLRLGRVTERYSVTVPLDRVIAQQPASGQLPPGATVDLVISLGPASVQVPGVVGLTRSEAEAAIGAAQLVVGVVREEYDPGAAAGVVLGQFPTAQEGVLAGSAVDLVVSKGPEPVPVPNVVGMLLVNARGAIAAAGLAVGTVIVEYSATVPAGAVIRQEPESGALPPGATVDLVVSKGPEPVAVPNVVGMSEAQARAAILAAGLLVGTVSEQYSASVAVGVVMTQTPAAGTLLPGQTVRFVVSKGPQPVAVPNVIGMGQPAARAAIEAAGLVVGGVSEQYSPVASGVVIGQAPVSGTLLPGGAVSLVVSKGPQPVEVPNVVGLSRADALAALAAAGLSVGAVRERYSDTGPLDVVLEQNPANGTVPVGSTVELVVSNRKRGDIDRSGAVNATDVQLVINAALGRSGAPGGADVDGSGRVNAADVQWVINAVLGRN